MKKNTLLQSLLLLKGRIKSLELDMNTIDSETMQGRLKVMYNQVERLLDKLNMPVIKSFCDICKQPLTDEEIKTGHCFNCGEQDI